MHAEEIQTCVLYRDDDFLVIDKPAGLAAHRAPGAGRTIEALLPDLRFERSELPGLAHRLDRDTSGCLVLGRHPGALRELNALFAAGHVQKRYWAVVQGGPKAESGSIDIRLRKVQRQGGWEIVAGRGGDVARTDWRLLGRGPDTCWLEATPLTGRTHQIRVHLAARRMPVLGDSVYGPPPPLGVRLHLHARSVILQLGSEPIEVEATPPRHMWPALVASGWSRPA
jgi:tRNA pseudouridine32 synthase/23S rRNA pseudouridine746 synthase/23S rRNA pseudouridine1911/1915/1917 synthase